MQAPQCVAVCFGACQQPALAVTHSCCLLASAGQGRAGLPIAAENLGPYRQFRRAIMQGSLSRFLEKVSSLNPPATHPPAGGWGPPTHLEGVGQLPLLADGRLHSAEAGCPKAQQVGDQQAVHPGGDVTHSDAVEQHLQRLQGRWGCDREERGTMQSGLGVTVGRGDKQGGERVRRQGQGITACCLQMAYSCHQHHNSWRR